MEGNKVMFALLLLVALCAVVAIIISAVTLSRPSSVPTITLNGLGGRQSPPVVVGGGVGGGGSGGSTTSGRVYTIAVGHDWGAQEYLDEKNFVQGFNKDIILEVCENAGIDCRIVWDSYTNCWRSIPGDHSMGGVGAIDGWVFDEKCIGRQDNIAGNILPQYTMKYFALGNDLATALHDGTVDAAFGDEVTLNQFIVSKGDVFERVNSPKYYCAIQGHSIMTREDNDLIPLWNRGFEKMKESGRFKALCEEAKTKHGHQGNILPCAD